MAKFPSYVLITPARNEAQFIELTIKSVVAQTVVPLKWVIVSDGSTDGTEEIVGRYTPHYPWIELVCLPERRGRHFAGKAYAFNAGYERLKGYAFDILGNLDADLSFDPGYLAYLLDKLSANPRLGVTGTTYVDPQCRAQCDYRYASTKDVPGACQLFRRECYEEIGGYKPVKGGNLDTIAALSARMKGWQTETFTEKVAVHHRESGTAQKGVISARFDKGKKAYCMGSHPVFMLARSFYQLTQKPFVVGGLAVLGGYLWSAISRADRPVSHELMAFNRREQMQRLRGLVLGQHP